ncbi:hypothetical protein [Photorhabdus laumondii]|nr:hypothetical protein [Photorhabdus laumondii]
MGWHIDNRTHRYFLEKEYAQVPIRLNAGQTATSNAGKPGECQ